MKGFLVVGVESINRGDIMLKSNIGEIIKNSPYRRDYIEKHMEVSTNTLSNWCRGKTTPKAEDLFKLAKLLGKSVDELYEYTED
ncbi:DNA-binding transcriptional regulator, XRE-family HTH domain [Oceanobacillus limi]|uniref:DNA-binding transcriptional regulator, XRE-family HTH domain n=1 Tax=Oceanobacillus limi TaxID=930131 RepID=A0A1I0GEX5_9BACI|nr:helix-turn-helix transcriptional regulator [Oceanobacillus limi]SET69439.1 DNA-binding transcriptional regulator, XRE-family HTH domain [Oceanobacillus limi]